MATATAANHLSCLVKLCRLCGNYVGNDSFDVISTRVRVDQTFFTEVGEERAETHPPKICMKCFTVMRHIKQRGTTPSNFSIKHWPQTCSLERCICFVKKSGRKKKKQCGRPPSGNKVIWTRESLNVILDSFSDMSRMCYESINIADHPHKDLCVCMFCKRIIHRPVLLNNCQHLFCATCIFPNLIGKLETEAKCPICCSNITLGSISKATAMQNILESIALKCSKNTCNDDCVMQFDTKSISNKEEHEQVYKSENISYSCSASSHSSLTVADIYKIDKNYDIPKELDYAFAHFAKLKKAKNNSHSFELPSGGLRAIQFSATPKIYKTSTDISQKTIPRRQKQLHQSLIENAGPTKKAKMQQVALMLNSFDKNDKIDILKKAGSEDIVSLKADCGLPWEKMKKMIRFFKSKNVKLPSLSNQRKVSKNWSGDDLVVEDKEFLVESINKRGTFDLQQTPTANINDLSSHLIKVLNELERHNQLMYDKITPGEIHIKIGGDYGGSSLKMCYQLANVVNPNSKNNTTIFNIFKAKDYRANLKIELSRHTDKIRQIQSMKWREKNFRVFIFGDFEFLCPVYGISGATGRHCCLFCEITKNEMQLSMKDRNQSIFLRTLESLKSDFERFKNDGGNNKNAKKFNNVIDEPLFDIPIEQIAIPALHITLGIFLKFFNLLEKESHLLDIKLAGVLAIHDKRIDLSEYDDYVEKQVEIFQLKYSIEDINNKILLIQDACVIEVIHNPENSENIKVMYKDRIALLESKRTEKEGRIAECFKVELNQGAGPIVKEIESVLQSCGVLRQAFHSRSFIGNHIHKMLLYENIIKLCNSVPETVFNHINLPEHPIQMEAIGICKKFKVLFEKFSKCHKEMNSCEIFNNTKVQSFEATVHELLTFFRTNWPNESITPKMHMLEDHMEVFLNKWGVGLGLYGEQGGESIHAEFINIERLYSNMSGTRKLESVMRDHYTRNNSISKSLKVPIIPRKKKITN
nr:uncharacterized protein LOC124809337 [Hydra vulgaris]